MESPVRVPWKQLVCAGLAAQLAAMIGAVALDNISVWHGPWETGSLVVRLIVITAITGETARRILVRSCSPRPAMIAAYALGLVVSADQVIASWSQPGTFGVELEWILIWVVVCRWRLRVDDVAVRRAKPVHWRVAWAAVAGFVAFAASGAMGVAALFFLFLRLPESWVGDVIWWFASVGLGGFMAVSSVLAAKLALGRPKPRI